MGPKPEIEDGDLAARILDCIAQADAGGLHVVAAYLETALYALPPSGDHATEVPHRQDD